MAGFDPDAYLAKKSAPSMAFDPDAYLAAQPASGIPGQRAGVEQIPTEPGANLTPTVEQPRSMFQRAMGNLETIPALAGGMVGGAIAPVAGVVGALTSGKYGTQEGVRAGEAAAQQMQNQFYQPRTPEAQRNLGALGEATAPLVGVPLGTMADLSRGGSAGIRSVNDLARSEGSLVGGSVNAALNARNTRIAGERAAESYANAPMLEAMQSVKRIGGVVPPAISNPTRGNIVRAKLAGEGAIEENMAKANETRITNEVRKDLGMRPADKFDAKAIDSALNRAGKPNDVIKEIPVLTPDATVIAQLESLKKPVSAVNKNSIGASNTLIDNMLKEVSEGRSGENVLSDIRALRREAIDVYKRKDKGINVPTSAELAEADARMGIAKAYEQMIDANVGDPKILADIQAGRTKQAQIYEHARALDYGLQKIDPQAYAKMYEESRGKMTGLGADIGVAAKNFPQVFTLSPTTVSPLQRFSRGTLGGMAGATIGSLAGPGGAAVGLATGTAAGALAGSRAAKQMATPAYQAKAAYPKDYRPQTNNLRPTEADISNALTNRIDLRGMNPERPR